MPALQVATATANLASQNAFLFLATFFGQTRANGLDLWDGHCSNRQRNGQGLADLTCTTDKPNLKFRGLLRNPEVLSP